MTTEPKSTHIQPAQVVSGIEQTVVHVPRLTVKKLADMLVEVEIIQADGTTHKAAERTA